MPRVYLVEYRGTTAEQDKTESNRPIYPVILPEILKEAEGLAPGGSISSKRKARGAVILALSLLVLAGCQARMVRPEPARGDQAGLYVYLRPLPESAVRLRFIVAGVAAVDGAGNAVPLKVRMAEIDGGESGRQRLLAAGTVPAGSYRGLAVTFAAAWLRGADGEAALRIPEEPVIVAMPFVVGRREARLAEIDYRHEDPVEQGFRFRPSLFAYMPSRPVVSRLGYAASFREDILAVFDRKTLEVVSVIATGRGPASVVLDERERRAYVALSQEDAVEVVDVSSGLVVARVPLQAGDAPAWLALAQNGLLLSANRGSNTMSFIDGRSAVEVGRVQVGNEPVYVLVDRPGRRAYVFNARSDFITVADLARRAVVGTVATDSGPFRGSFNRASDRLYVIHRDSPYLTVIDASRLTRVERLLVGMGACDIHVDTDTDFVYVGKKDSTVLDVYDPFSLLPIDFIPVPGAPADMAIDREENRLLLAVAEADAVVAVDLVNKSPQGVLDVGTDPRSLEMMGARR
jgi:YVTN family beta-propeller protein